MRDAHFAQTPQQIVPHATRVTFRLEISASFMEAEQFNVWSLLQTYARPIFRFTSCLCWTLLLKSSTLPITILLSIKFSCWRYFLLNGVDNWKLSTWRFTTSSKVQFTSMVLFTTWMRQRWARPRANSWPWAKIHLQLEVSAWSQWASFNLHRGRWKILRYQQNNGTRSRGNSKLIQQ